jgi:hypothetical protein
MVSWKDISLEEIILTDGQSRTKSARRKHGVVRLRLYATEGFASAPCGRGGSIRSCCCCSSPCTPTCRPACSRASRGERKQPERWRCLMPAPSDDDNPAPKCHVPSEVTHKGLTSFVTPLGPTTFRRHGGGRITSGTHMYKQCTSIAREEKRTQEETR